MSEHNYLLLTPGPLTTSKTVKEAMLFDSCTWDEDYNLGVVQSIRQQLVGLATQSTGYTSVLLQGSGSFAVEAVLGTVIGPQDKLLIVNNGAYGARMVEMARLMDINHHAFNCGEVNEPDVDAMEAVLKSDTRISHIAMVHCETTTGMLNPLQRISGLAARNGKTLIVDAMSSFGGIPLDVDALGIDYLISSANKCIQGVPGFAFVIARHRELEKCIGRSRSLSLDLYAQWRCMEDNAGKWRFTSPTHTLLAFAQALRELEQEGGINARNARYCANQQRLVAGMRALGFETLLDDELHSPIITAFYSPKAENYRFSEFYQRLKQQGFVIYPGKVSQSDCFRIGNIGEVYPQDIDRLLAAVGQAMYWER
ncbi:2-aminoethylphosphonate--pyruvate transaminase [Serratia grimesii]|uniref:2-aminoethylphosphonate--pyruvate transaminase n=1 Tax=Serratia grimesii TaxID=82995 RepID=UPI00077C173A|nr:2-aminoethylphosphonate--pyruvate transaminase [Serratia grimesii]CAI0704891.1 2-aminoethylphosphonate--pyruvate transaminase [Serratia grimesii]CAI0875500.1 2-aminoethylphosphonate--pyruvate transaminase [Serratia grimesii]CAI2438700.1 2-aminoethylphosphonate--pyruvate transaminase [Serratia grimesii]CAI2784706.1 2-aminoethylphosphonate--pyruvate transaminase [Serratia grimesii]SUI33205.1 2-aminoethylphosphonate--pyruvate transaminase [Serratia grimesii]